MKLAMAAPDGTSLTPSPCRPTALGDGDRGIQRWRLPTLRRSLDCLRRHRPWLRVCILSFRVSRQPCDRVLRQRQAAGDRPGCGPAKILCDAPIGRGGTWSAAGDRVSPTVSGPLYRVSSSGGKPRRPLPCWTHRNPTSRTCGRNSCQAAAAFCIMRSRATLRLRNQRGGRRCRCIPPRGSCRFWRRARRPQSDVYSLPTRRCLTALPFHSKRAAGSGDLYPSRRNCGIEPLSRYAFLSTSQTGTVAFVPGSPFDQELVWLDPKGSAPIRAGSPAGIISVRVSPNGELALVGRNDEQTGRPGVSAPRRRAGSCAHSPGSIPIGPRFGPQMERKPPFADSRSRRPVWTW